ncbi:MAG: hypothetical protein WC340_14390 [Kiritimatiellia bacterium]
MARRLGGKNSLKVEDNISGTTVTMFYALPTNKQRLAYQGASVERKGNRIINKTAEARQKYGLEILTGIKAGDLEVPDGDEWVPLITDAGYAGYDPDWKDVVLNQASDLIELLAAHVFDVSARVSPDQGEDAEKN